MNIKQKILNKFGYSVKSIEDRKDGLMGDSQTHFQIQIKNKESKKAKSFLYSISTKEASLFLGLVNCIYSDRIYIDYDEFKGLGYDEDSKKDDKIYKAICKNNQKAEVIGLNDFFDSLTDEEQQKLHEGF